MEIKIPNNIKIVLDKLKENNYKAYIVGGCVRDSLIGREPHDWDITTDATPEQVMELFDKVIPTGIKFGTVTVVLPNGDSDIDKNIEVTTFRKDGKYSDCRHPDNIEFSTDIIEDLSRRDFTMNAIAYSPDEGFIDPFNAIKAIENNAIMAVGNPDERVKEDPLRILRAIRFSCQLKDFFINNELILSITKYGEQLKLISKERIRDELNKIMISDYIENFLFLEIIGDTTPVLGFDINKMKIDQNNPYHDKSLLDHTLSSMMFIKPSSVDNDNKKLNILRLAMLYHDLGKLYTESKDDQGISHYFGHEKVSVKLTRDILKNLKYDNKTIDIVCTLIEYHDYPILKTTKSIKRLLNKIGEDNLRMLLTVKIADFSAQKDKFYTNRIFNLLYSYILLDRIISSKDCFTKKGLKINGNILKQQGFQGKKIGEILDDVLDKVIENELENDESSILEYIKKYKE